MERLKKQLKKHKRRISSESEEGTSNLKISQSNKRKLNSNPGIKVYLYSFVQLF